MSRNLVTRIAVAAVGIPAILWFAYEGGWWLFGMLGLFLILSTFEMLAAEHISSLSPLFWYTVLTVCSVYYLVSFGLSNVTPPFGQDFSVLGIVISPMVYILYLLLAGMGLAIGKDAPNALFGRYTRLVWGVAYLGFLYPVVFALGVSDGIYIGREISGGDSLLFLFGILWVGDTAAMGVGSWIGRRKLAPAVSPNKTVEGFLGGVFGAMLVGGSMTLWKFSVMEWYHVLIIAVGCSVFGQLGDLVESMWKRSLGLKDSSAIIPGHGGVLDRFDSLLFAAPFMYVYLLFLR